LAHLKHEHLIVRAEIKNPPRAHDIKTMNAWFEDLIESIGMKILMGPFCVYSEMVGNRGFTGICAIETSSITLHVWDEANPAFLQLDVYTCSDVNLDTVFDCMRIFMPDNIEYLYVDRNREIRILKHDKFWLPSYR
jgi:S-adenosylmethionine/arginine decarboxylase-like enzyme